MWDVWHARHARLVLRFFSAGGPLGEGVPVLMPIPEGDAAGAALTAMAWAADMLLPSTGALVRIHGDPPCDADDADADAGPDSDAGDDDSVEIGEWSPMATAAARVRRLRDRAGAVADAPSTQHSSTAGLETG